jgi:hypothetical protein
MLDPFYTIFTSLDDLPAITVPGSIAVVTYVPDPNFPDEESKDRQNVLYVFSENDGWKEVQYGLNQ